MRAPSGFSSVETTSSQIETSSGNRPSTRPRGVRTVPAAVECGLPSHRRPGADASGGRGPLDAALGLTSAQIAVVLRISVGTVNKHLENAYRKLGASSRVLAIERARARGAFR